MYVSASLSQRTTWHECHIIRKNQKDFLSRSLDQSPNRVTYIEAATPHTASPSCPSRQNLQGATPEKCVSLKFRCCFISLPPLATPVGTNLCLEPSQAQYKTTRTAREICKTICIEELRRTKWVSATPIRLLKTLRIKAKIKSDVCVSYLIFQCSKPTPLKITSL